MPSLARSIRELCRGHIPAFIERTKKPSTYAGYRTYFERYIKPRVGNYAVRDFTVAIVSSLLDQIACEHTLNTATVGKIRSLLSGIFTYAIGKGHFPARSTDDNPASRALIPESATEPKATTAATRDDVKAVLARLAAEEMILERAAVALVAFMALGPEKSAACDGKNGTGLASKSPSGARCGMRPREQPRPRRATALWLSPRN